MYFFTDCHGNRRRFTTDQIIANATYQERIGVEPMYRRNYGNGEYSDRGYLVVSMFDGCIVAIPHGVAGFTIVRGWQGDFVCG